MKKNAIGLGLVLIFSLVACNLPFTITVNTPGSKNNNVPSATQGISVSSTNTEIASSATPVVITSTPLPPTTTATTQFAGVNRDFNGVKMTIPSCLASDGSLSVIPENNAGSDAPPFASNPEYREIKLTGYPLSNDFWEPNVEIFPVDKYTVLVSDIATMVTNLQQILNSQPMDFQKDIPLLPIQNAAQLIKVKIDYQSFINGEGIGFLTEYAQAYVPIDNTDLFYTYQGLTKDGKYWVSIFLPVNASYLQKSSSSTDLPSGGIAAPDPNSSNFSADYQNYYSQMTNKLESTASDQFTPTLSCIDQFIQSLNVGDQS